MLKCFKWKCPKFLLVKKCCFVIPVRKGVILFGYVNLVLSLLAVPLLIFLLVEQVILQHKVVDQLPMDPLVQVAITIVCVLVDVSMTLVLLIGAHKKRRALLKGYFYCGVLFQVLTLSLDVAYFDFREHLANTIYFFFLGLNIYLLILVYNLIKLLDEENMEVQYQAHQDTYNYNVTYMKTTSSLT